MRRASSFYGRKGKRRFDLLLVALTSPLWITVLVVAGGVAYLCQGRPVLFTQKRTGLDGRIFRAFKFRSMSDGRDRSGRLLPDSSRLTAVGKLFRSLSLDEFPMIFNVVRGEMSLVGPRPLLPEYLDRYSPEQARRHDAVPGITGWAQVNGRNSLGWERRFELDVWYVDRISFRLDIRVLCQTFWTMIKREGIHFPGLTTMEEFRGTERAAERS